MCQLVKLIGLLLHSLMSLCKNVLILVEIQGKYVLKLWKEDQVCLAVLLLGCILGNENDGLHGHGRKAFQR
ncbi:hypothetical protein SDC9_106616 [bioreactor metagenome]|uniref:Uncharacterized protein n=1 Tax=bioreactor metagenome TaxID=1076179 RepID=A0A645B2T5_9ZZZZ